MYKKDISNINKNTKEKILGKLHLDFNIYKYLTGVFQSHLSIKDLEIKRNNVVLEKVDNLKQHKDSLSLISNKPSTKADFDKPVDVETPPTTNGKSSKVTGRQLTSNKKGRYF